MKQEIQKRRRARITLCSGLVLTVIILVAVMLTYVGVTRELAAKTAAPFPSSAQPQPTSAHIVRLPGGVPNRPIEPLDRTITDSSQTQHLYQTILNLPDRLCQQKSAYRLWRCTN